MADRMSQFGARLGQAIAGGAESISQGLQQKAAKEYLAAQKKADEKKAQMDFLMKAYTQQGMEPGLAQRVSRPGFQQAYTRGLKAPPPLGAEEQVGGEKLPQGYSDTVSQFEQWRKGRRQMRQAELATQASKRQYYERGAGGPDMGDMLRLLGMAQRSAEAKGESLENLLKAIKGEKVPEASLKKEFERFKEIIWGTQQKKSQKPEETESFENFGLSVD